MIQELPFEETTQHYELANAEGRLSRDSSASDGWD